MNKEEITKKALSIYKLPLYIDEGDCQVYAQENSNHGLVMALDWFNNDITGDCYELNDIKKNIVRKINGENIELSIKFNTGKSAITIYSGDTPIMCIRGWGMLAGYPFRMIMEEASQIQDAFRDWIIEKLNN